MDAVPPFLDSVDLMSTILSMSFHFSGESQIQSPHTAFFPVQSQVLTIKIAHFFPLKSPVFMVKPPHVPSILPFYHNSVLIHKIPVKSPWNWVKCHGNPYVFHGFPTTMAWTLWDHRGIQVWRSRPARSATAANGAVEPFRREDLWIVIH